MGTKGLRLSASAVLIAYFPLIAVATNIPNGDFQNPNDLDYWIGGELGEAGFAVVEEVDAAGADDDLHILARNTYTWDGAQWVIDQRIDTGGGSYIPYNSLAQAGHPYVSGDPNFELLAPAGTTDLAFDVKTVLVTAETAIPPDAYLSVQVLYNGGAASATWDSSATSNWFAETIALPGIDTGLEISLLVTASSLAEPDNFPAGTTVGETAEVNAEGWFDNFGFIPEPTWLVFLGVCFAGLLLRRPLPRLQTRKGEE